MGVAFQLRSSVSSQVPSRSKLAARHLAGLDHLGASGRTEFTEVYPSQSAATEEIRTRAAKASSLEVLTVRGLGIVGMNDSLLRNALREGKLQLRLMLLDPECPDVAHRAKEIGESLESFTAGIRLAIARVQDLSQGDNVELYLYDRLPVWRVIGIDGLNYLSAFGADWEGHSSAMYKLARTPYGALHHGVRRHMEELRHRARRLL